MTPSKKTELAQHRRQFGRREISRPATATLANGLTAECRIINVSEGGALADFPGGLVPAKPFDLSIEGVSGTLACEPRHYRETAVGVRFLNEVEGLRLIALLFPGTQGLGAGEVPRRPEAAMVPVAVRDLRQRVFSAFPDRPGPETGRTPQPETILPVETPVTPATDDSASAD
jgi:hypothetical protein